MITVGHLAPAGCWDVTLVRALLDGALYPHGLEFKHVDGWPNPRNVDGAIIALPGRYWFDHYADINEALSHYEWVLAFRTGDEEDRFDVSQIHHPSLRWWVQTPRTDREYGAARLFGVGTTPHFNQLPTAPPDKTTDVFFSGQVTHERRELCFDRLAHVRDERGLRAVSVHATEGFTQGMDPAEYTRRMVAAKIAPAPAGPASPDTFRTWEALAAHTIPIADDITPGYASAGYWERLLPGCPFPILRNYESLPGYIQDVLDGWPANANRITAWWMRYKRSMALWLLEDLKALGAL